MRALIVAALLLTAFPAFAQPAPGAPDWRAIAAVLRNQRDQANDALVQQQVAAATQLQEANSKVAWWEKCAAVAACVSWVNPPPAPKP